MVNSNIPLDVFLNDPESGAWSEDQLSAYGNTQHLYINPIIYSEVSIGFSRIEDLEHALEEGGFIMLSLPKEALFLAGKVFLQYRRGKGTKRSPLPDFFIGTHAAVEKLTLLTRDEGHYPFYFPHLKIAGA